MADKPQRLKGRDAFLSLNADIDILNIAKVSSIAPANVAFSSTNDLLFLIRVRFLPIRVGWVLKSARVDGLQSGLYRTRTDLH